MKDDGEKEKQHLEPLDYETALEEFEGDEDFLKEVLNGFLDNVNSQIRTIRQALSEGDAETVRKEAHAIKGGAANLTADELSGIAFELENVGKSANLNTGSAILEELENAYSRLSAYAGENCAAGTRDADV